MNPDNQEQKHESFRYLGMTYSTELVWWHMKYNDKEKITLQQSAEASEIRDRIDTWLGTDVGQDYEIKKWESQDHLFRNHG